MNLHVFRSAALELPGPAYWRCLASLLLLTLGLVGCHTASGPEPSSNPLQLNHGRKWVVDTPILAHIRNLESAVQQLDQSPDHDHARLAAEIQEQLGRLVTNCTMKGPAHDALHQWLMPFLALSTRYSQAEDLPSQQQTLRAIQQALVQFNQYFE